jgi:hypothetical protein
VIEDLLGTLARNSPTIGSTLLILWLSLPQLAERFAIVAKVVAPFSKRARKRAAAEEEADEAERLKVEADRRKLLADAQAVAQTTATEATTAALVIVEKQCRECRDELQGMRDITGRLIDAVEGLMASDTPATRADARAAIRLARNAM